MRDSLDLTSHLFFTISGPDATQPCQQQSNATSNHLKTPNPSERHQTISPIIEELFNALVEFRFSAGTPVGAASCHGSRLSMEGGFVE